MLKLDAIKIICIDSRVVAFFFLSRNLPERRVLPIRKHLSIILKEPNFLNEYFLGSPALEVSKVRELRFNLRYSVVDDG